MQAKHIPEHGGNPTLRPNALPTEPRGEVGSHTQVALIFSIVLNSVRTGQ